MRSISCVFIWSFLRGRSSSSSVKKQCVQRISQTDVTRMFSNTGEKVWPMASFAYRLSNSFVVKSISNLDSTDKLFDVACQRNVSGVNLQPESLIESRSFGDDNVDNSEGAAGR